MSKKFTKRPASKSAASRLVVRVNADPQDLKRFRGEIAEISRKLKAAVRLRMLAVDFGASYRDKVTEFEGAVVARAEYQAGNIEILLRKLERGEVREQWFGLDRLEVVPVEA